MVHTLRRIRTLLLRSRCGANRTWLLRVHQYRKIYSAPLRKINLRSFVFEDAVNYTTCRLNAHLAERDMIHLRLTIGVLLRTMSCCPLNYSHHARCVLSLFSTCFCPKNVPAPWPPRGVAIAPAVAEIPSLAHDASPAAKASMPSAVSAVAHVLAPHAPLVDAEASPLRSRSGPLPASTPIDMTADPSSSTEVDLDSRATSPSNATLPTSELLVRSCAHST